jgi:hypothetical protein
MNRVLIFLIVFTSVLASCKKEEVSGEFDFEINGLGNIDANIGESKMVNLEVFATNGNPENVILALEDVPEGIIYSFENIEGIPNYYTTLAFTVTKQAKVGSYQVALRAIAGEKVKKYTFDLSVDGSLSMAMVVYDGSNWTSELNYGVLAEHATVKLFIDEASFAANTPFYTVETNSDGRAYFYKLNPGNYLFTVEKGSLSNIIKKQLVDGKMEGFATTGIFRYTSEIKVSSQPQAKIGDLRCRDIDGDWLLTENDRVSNDVLSIYKDVLSEKIIWIGE